AVPEALDHVILLDGMSKTFAMTGWRLGWGVMRPDLAAAVAKLQTNSNSCTSTFSQLVIPGALFGPQEAVTDMRQEFKRRRDAIVDGLNSIDGITCKTPAGAFYVFPNITALGMTSKETADRILKEANVAALAGTSFGKNGEGYMRFSYANSIENIEHGIQQIKDWVAKL
ncbi:MAG: aminotransferase class I/II-fold pyridoxal phosphate-dependent enzyme, partial [candidate division Zixibacteria bacterium]|nr:aminotransferase class I/II-fold pyridoxal phosphate-dependent enzyme [candidate division Zixibacteria bacterium]